MVAGASTATTSAAAEHGARRRSKADGEEDDGEHHRVQELTRNAVARSRRRGEVGMAGNGAVAVSAGEEGAAKFAALTPSPHTGFLEEVQLDTAELLACSIRPEELRLDGNVESRGS